MSTEQDAVAVERICSGCGGTGTKFYGNEHSQIPCECQMPEPTDAELRVGDAMWDALGADAWESDGTLLITEEDWPSLITAAITEYNAWLRERSREADVVEAVVSAGIRGKWGYCIEHDGEGALTAALTAMIGKEQGDDR